MQQPLSRSSFPLSAGLATLLCLAFFGADLLCGALFQRWQGIDALMFPLRPSLLDREILQQSFTAGTSFLMAMQKPAGNFVYEVDWTSGEQTRGDNQVRQAGAVWGLALVYRQTGRADVLESLVRAIAYFKREPSPGEDGGVATLFCFPGERFMRTGTVALLLLAHLDAIDGRVKPPDAMRETLIDDGGLLLDVLLALRRPDGHFYESMDCVSAERYGGPSPYYDGEALLAMTRAARILGRDDLKPSILASASIMRDDWLIEARRVDPDSARTKGFFQWGIMAFHEMSVRDWPEAAWCPVAITDLADWMIDVHHTLWRTKNTAYALEGLLHALDTARRQGDRHRERRYRHVCRVTLEKLTSWQVGGPIPTFFIRRNSLHDPAFVGGIQNSSFDPRLRIDVTQHQLHAIMLALEFLYPPTRE